VEIFEFLKGRWLALLIVAPLVAGVAAGALAASAVSPVYEARARSSVAQSLGVGAASFSADSVIADFRSAIKSEQVADEVARRLSIPTADVRGRLSSTIAGPEVTNVDIAFRARSAELAADGVQLGGRAALELMALVKRDIAKQAEIPARARVEKAAADFAALEARTHLRDVVAEYRQRGVDLLSLRSQIAAATGDPVRVASLSQLLAQKTQEQSAYGAVLGEYQRLQAKLDKAASDADDAGAAVAEAEAVLATVREGDILTGEHVAELGSAPVIAQSVVAAVMGALALTLGVAFVARRRALRTLTHDVNHLGPSSVASPRERVPV
jgi:hypothetical protein